MGANYKKFMEELTTSLVCYDKACSFTEINDLEMFLFKMNYIDFESENERKKIKETIENAIGRIAENMRCSDTYKTFGTTLYHYAFNNKEKRFVEFLSKITDKDKLFDLVRKRVAKITSDHYINRYQTLTEMRYQELGGKI